MNIRTKLTLNFTSVVAIILISFSTGIYYFTSKHQDEYFNFRLYNKAVTTVKQFIDTKQIDFNLQQLIDSTTVNTMYNLHIYIYNDADKLIYYNKQSITNDTINLKLIKLIRQQHKISIKNNNNYLIGFIHKYKQSQNIVIASATDLYGPHELQNLLKILILGLAISLFFVLINGIINTKQALSPILSVIKQVKRINASRLDERVLVKNENDEIGILSITFNKMLDRIEKAFKMEREFVSNASHELRTPLTSINGDIEVTLLKNRSIEEYKETLQDIHVDIQNLTIIINGFLQLAETDIEDMQLEVSSIRIDDILYQIKDDITKLNYHYIIKINFERQPLNESQFTIQGNAYFIRILLKNIIDNAFKFSETKKISIHINYDDKHVILKIEDNGIGIPDNEIQHIFNPFYRAENAKTNKGHGIGLSIVQRIVLIHKGTISIKSQLNIGTTVTITLPFKM